MGKKHKNILFAALGLLCLAAYADPMPVIIMDRPEQEGAFYAQRRNGYQL